MLDWLTLKLEAHHLTESSRNQLDNVSSMIQKVSPEGEILWNVSSFESLRSDMQGIAYSFGTELILAGSPASCISDNNVFGTNEPIKAFHQMIMFFRGVTGIEIPTDPTLWKCTRMDVTQNYDLGGQIAVNQALDYLRHATTRGRNTERRQSTVYWNKTSSLRSAKAYNKFEHAKVVTAKNRAHYTKQQLNAVKNILRLELKLGRHWFLRKDINWYQLTPENLLSEHENFFKSISSNLEVPTMDSLLNVLINSCPTEGQAKSAFDFYLRIRQLGHESAKRSVPLPTYYRHTRNLRNAGITNADMNSGEILSFRPKLITMTPVNDWHEINVA